MKKRLFSLLLATLVLGSCIVATSRGQTGQPQQAAPQQPVSQPTTKIAVLNLSYVVKNYAKYVDFSNSLKAEMQGYEERHKVKKAQLDVLVDQAKKLPATAAPAQREQLEKNITAVTRELEDIVKSGKSHMGQKTDEQLVVLYREIQMMAQRYAQARNFEMVLHFNDASPSASEYYSPGNVARKMQAGALMPLYVHPGMDISYQVVQTLNQSYRPSTPTNGQPATGQPRP